MHHARRGSILLFCLAIVATLSVLAYGFVRVVQLHQETNAHAVQILLAREAARMGVAHGIEQIMRDYITEPFTRMDGPARVGFLPHDMPYLTNPLNLVASTYVWNAGLSRYVGSDLDDVSGSRLLFPPLFSEWRTGAYAGAGVTFNWAYDGSRLQSQGGLSASDGRGNYIEPNWSNRLAGPIVAVPPKIRFGQSSATTPERNTAIFYDEHWQRVAGDSRVARDTARYRLRYTVSVTDLDGEILVNPDPQLSALPERVLANDPDPRLDYRRLTSADPRTYPAAAARIVRAQHAVVPMIQALGYHGDSAPIGNTGATGGVKAEHVFIGRGFTSNFDQADQATGDDTPRFFPLMFRKSSTLPSNFFRYFLNNQDATGVPASPPWEDPAPRLFTMGGVAAVAAGGQTIPLPVFPAFTLRRALMGPQYSFYNFDAALYSNNWREDWNNAFARDGEVKSLGCLTPFGRGLTRDAAHATRYSGASDTPWAVNVLTAPVQVVSGMVYGYMPPGTIAAFAATTGSYAPVWLESRNPRDLFVAEISPIFPYSAPQGEGVDPNYRIEHVRPGDTGYRSPGSRYPGEMGYNGLDSGSAPAHDTLGYYLRASMGGTPGIPKPTAAIIGKVAQVSGDGADLGGYDPYAAIPFMKAVFSGNSPPTPSRTYRAGVPSGLTNGCFTTIHPDSVWRAIAQAMAAAVAVARGQLMSVPSAAADPATLFDGGPWSDVRVQSIDDLDRLFLANLGINIADPGNPTPPAAGAPQSLKAWYGKINASANASGVKVDFVSFAPGWNVASLRGLPAFDEGAPLPVADHPHAPYLAKERTAVIELIINDFRLSFFGSNPAYADFQALDLNGDGMVTCSGLGVNPAATARERALGIDHAAVGTGLTVPVANVFSHTGCFTVTKSHFWRIMTRGEVWDNFFKTVVSEAALDTVVCIDPMDLAQEVGGPATRNPAAGQFATHVMYQKWVFDFNRSSLSQRQ